MSLTYKTQFTNDGPYHQYFDISILNNTPTTGEMSPNIIYDIAWAGNGIIPNGSDYYASIVRFNVQTSNALPVFVAEPELDNTNVNVLSYKIAIDKLGDGTAVQTANITYIPTDQSLSLTGNVNTNKLGNPYYWVYNINRFVTMVNNTLSSLATALSIDIPIMMYDEKTALMNIYIPTTWTTTKLYFNNQLQNLFDGFDWSLLTNTYNIFSTSFKTVYSLNYYFKNNTATFNSKTYNVMTQSYSTLAIFNPVQSIMFLTTMLPVNQTLSTPQTIYGPPTTYPNANSKGSGSNNNITPIITDFIVNANSLNSQYKPNIVYEPQAEYRLFDIVSSDNLKNIQVEIKWKDKYNFVYPLKLATGNTANIKLLFRRKDYGNVVL